MSVQHPSKSSRPELPISELFQLKPGEKFVVFWAKDDNMRDIRLKYETHSIESTFEGFEGKDPGFFSGDGHYAWYKHEWCEEDGSSNMLDTSRGYAYFFKYEDK